ADLDHDRHDDLVIVTNIRAAILLTGPTPGNPTVFTNPTLDVGADARVVAHPDGSHSVVVLVYQPALPAPWALRPMHVSTSGQITLRPLMPLSGTGMLAAGDVDNDGLEDVVSFRMHGTFEVVRQIPGNQFALGPLLNGGPATGLADVDG